MDGDDIPGVDQAGEVAKAAESDINERVGGANAAFNPDYKQGQYTFVGADQTWQPWLSEKGKRAYRRVAGRKWR